MAEVTLLIRGSEVAFRIDHEGDAVVVRQDDDREIRLRLTPVAPGVLRVTAAGMSRLMHVAEHDGRWFVHLDGVTLEYAVRLGGAALPGRGDRTRGGPASAQVSAPMSGQVTQVLVGNGDAVKPGHPLVIVEAMKMEHVVRATRAGTVRTVRVHAGDQVEGGTVIVEIDPGLPPGDAIGMDG